MYKIENAIINDRFYCVQYMVNGIYWTDFFDEKNHNFVSRIPFWLIKNLNIDTDNSVKSLQNIH